VSGPKTVGLLGVPLDLGAGRRGTDMGPSAIRIAGLTRGLEKLGITVDDHGYVAVPAPETRKAGRTHSIAMGTVAGVAKHHAERDEKIGLLWVDAHADLNTPNSSPTGNVHGMPLATILGNGDPLLMGIGPSGPWVDPKNVAIIGLRDVDVGEKKWIRDHGLRVFSMKQLDRRGISACIQDALEVVTNGTAGFHLSFDMDSLDPDEAPGVGTPVPGGLTYREAHLACELAADTGNLCSLEIVETNPILDERNVTGKLAVELALSALGKTIY
jgi:arginase